MKRLILAVLIVCWPLSAMAATSFTWNANTEPDCAGYRLYLKNKATGVLTKLGPDVMGKATTTATVTIPDVVGIDQFTVVATAFDLAGNESDKSLEATKDGVVYFWKDVTAPLAPQLLKVLQLIAGSLERIALALEKGSIN